MITEIDNIPLVKDFLLFANYTVKYEVGLTKTNQWIARKHLGELNARVSDPQTGVSARSDQVEYPILNLFYHLGLAAGILRIGSTSKGKSVLQPTERMTLFMEMNHTEQYMCLLETLWIDADWDNLQYRGDRAPSYYDVHGLLEYLEQLPEGSVFEVKDAAQHISRIFRIWEWNFFLIYLECFGLWKFERDLESSKEYKNMLVYYVKTLTPTNLLRKLSPILRQTRDLEEWNLSLRKERGDWLCEQEESFIHSFIPLFSEGELVRTLPRMTGQFYEGTYDLKVALRRNCWRIIRISSHMTLDQLHHAIQKAFGLGNDHLYAFFMDGKRWSRKDAFYSPDDGEEPRADEAELGELGLSEGRSFVYLFDYGAEWTFEITVERALELDTRHMKYQLLDSKGESPSQYSW